jgi:hypothetical protein
MDREVQQLRADVASLRAEIRGLRPHVFDREEATGGGDGFKDIRYNPANKFIEVAFESPGVTWIPKIEFKPPCDNP